MRHGGSPSIGTLPSTTREDSRDTSTGIPTGTPLTHASQGNLSFFPGGFSDENDQEIPSITPQPETPVNRSTSSSAREVEESLRTSQQSESLEGSRSTTPKGNTSPQGRAGNRKGKSRRLESFSSGGGERTETDLGDETRSNASGLSDGRSYITPELAQLLRETAHANKQLREENRKAAAEALENSKKAIAIAEETRRESRKNHATLLEAISRLQPNRPVDTGSKSTQMPTPQEASPQEASIHIEQVPETPRYLSRRNSSDDSHLQGKTQVLDPLSPWRGRSILPDIFGDVDGQDKRRILPQTGTRIPTNALFNKAQPSARANAAQEIQRDEFGGRVQKEGRDQGTERKKESSTNREEIPPGQRYTEADWDEYNNSRSGKNRKPYDSSRSQIAKPRANETTHRENEVRFNEKTFDLEPNDSTSMRNSRAPIETWEMSIRPAANILDEEVSQVLMSNNRRPTLPTPDDNIVRMLRKAFVSEEEAARRSEMVNLSRLGVKLPAPESYDGKGDPIVFENWLTKVLGWFNMMNLNAKTPEMNQLRVQMLSQLLTGKALTYYKQRTERMKAGDEYQFEAAIVELKDRFLRGSSIMDASRRYDEMTQGTRDVQTLVEDLYNEGKRLPDGGPPPFMFKVRLLEAMRPDYVQHIIREGLRPETSTLNAIVMAAIDYEDSIAYEKKYTKSRVTTKEQKPSPPKKESETKKPMAKEPSRRFQHPSSRVQPHNTGRPVGNTNFPGPRPDPPRNVPHKSNPPRPADKDKPPFKATCFNCGQEGHISPNCPKKGNPPRAYAGRIEEAGVEGQRQTPQDAEQENIREDESENGQEEVQEDQEEAYEGEQYSPENELYRYSSDSESEDNNRLDARAARLVPWDDPITRARAAKLNDPPRPTVHRHRSRPKEDGSQPLRDKNLQKCIELTVNINGLNARALLDTGSTTDMVSPSFVQVAKLRAVELETPMALQLAVSGSRTKINYGVWGKLSVGPISESRYFDVANIDDYDVILGTPFCWKHGISPIFEEGGWVRHTGNKLVGNPPNASSRAQDKPRTAKAHAEQSFRKEGPFRSTDGFFRGEGQSFRD